jgi:hypothetical protein
MATPPFALTFDYRCPFARNVHEHVIAGLAAGASWDVRFTPFSLSQAKVEPGQPDTWDDPEADSGLLALMLGVAVRDTQPHAFLAAHRALFALRHDRGRSIRDEGLLRATLTDAGVDADGAFDEVESGRPLEVVRREHDLAVTEHEVWGVPTFTAEGECAFVRLMDRPGEDPARTIAGVERIVELLVGWPSLNEFKHTSISR